MTNTKDKKRKIFIIDTSVLLYDKCAIHSFPGNDTIIPLVVLEELDRFKDKKGIVGENARYVNRYLDDLRSKGCLHNGIKIENDQKVKVTISGFDNVPIGLDKTSVDNQIIKDESEFYKGYSEIEVEDGDLIDDLYENSDLGVPLVNIVTDKLGRKLYENEFISIRCGKQTFLGCFYNNYIQKVHQAADLPGLNLLGVKDKNREQLFALNLLFEDEIPLVSITGLAGSGKTFLTLMAGLAGLNEGKYKRIVITRNTQPVGRDIGFLPGDMNEKMLPWMSPIMDNFRQGLKDKDLTYFKSMKDRGQIEIAPLSFMRGRTFSDTFFIIDEAQNATIHELKTVITRMGENSKIVLLNGLTIVAEKFKDEPIAGHIQLKKGERSYLSAVAAKIL